MVLLADGDSETDSKATVDELLARVAELEQDMASLRASEEKYRRLFTEMQEGCAICEMILDEDGEPVDFRINAVNAAYEHHTGIKVQDAIGKTIRELRPAVDPRQIAIYGEVALGGEPRAFDYYSPAFGRHLRIRAFSPMRGTFATIFEDITDRKRAEQALREQEARWAFAIEVAGAGVLDWNVATGEMQFSDGWFSVTGYSRDELPPRLESLTSLVHPDDLPRAMADVQEVLAGRKTVHVVEHRLKHKEGHWIWVQARSLISAWSDQREPIHMIGTHTDITERKRAEQERANLEAQLHQAQKIESVGRLAGGVAHDFNNMLSVILGHTELALMQVDRAMPLHEDLEAIRKAANRSADLTRQLLAFARKQTATPKVLDLNETVAGMLKMLQRLISENVHLVWLPDPRLWAVKVDPSQIDQILANLCVNARDAMDEVGTLTIETGNSTFDAAACAAHEGAVPGDYVRLAVSDDGCGMDDETKSHLFEPFFTTKAVGAGTGLGLATVYGIVKQNRGFVVVDSELGRGTTLEIYLPRHDGPIRQAGTGAAPRSTATGRETILLVEDEKAVLRLATRMLEDRGYAVLAADTPGEALRLGKDHAGAIDMLITDVVMPEMNGRELAETLMSFHPRLKRMFMSGYPADVIAHHGVLDDGVAFLQKPFPGEVLAAKVREALDVERSK